MAPRAFGLANSSVSSLNFSHNGEQYMITSALVGRIRHDFAVQYPLGNFGIWIWQVEDLISNDQNWTRDEAIAQGALLQLEGHRDGVRQGVFSHDDAKVATAGLDGRVRMWDTARGEMLLDIDAHFEAAWDVDFSPDDAVVASVGWDGRLKFWDSATGENVGIDEHYQTALTAVAYSPDGTQLVIGGWDGRVWIRDLVTNEERVLRHSHFWEHWDLDFSPDDNYLAVAADNNEIWIWDLDRRVEYRGLQGHEGPVHSVDFSPDGRRLVSGSLDQTVRVWDVERGMEVVRFDDFHNSVKRVLYSPDGNLIAGADFSGMIYVWDADSGALRHHFQAESDAIAFSIDGHYLAAGSEAWRLDGSSRKFDRRDVAERKGEMYFQDDSTNFDGTIRITSGGFIDVEADRYIFRNDRPERCTKRDWAFNHESSLVAIACDDGDIRLWGVGQ
jgi:WD40 repeat protein